MEKSSRLTTAYDMWVWYKKQLTHYALIIPPDSLDQSCRLKLAKAFGWENPEDRSSWEFTLPNILNSKVEVHLMKADSGVKFSPENLFRHYKKHHIYNRDEFILEIITDGNTPEQVKLVKKHLDTYSMYLGGVERNSKYDSERWEKQIAKL